ncbi:MAG: cell division protein FtsI [Rhodobacteraceae bacterium]|nr:cell division protein FtsI [Paracoccaceae bacterium]
MMSSNSEKIFTEYPRTRRRLFLFGLLVFTGFSLIGAKIAFLASKENQKSNSYFQEEKIHSRLNITDRNGYILATNLEGVSIYIRPQEIQKKSLVAKKLKNIFPDLDEVELLNKLKDGRKFFWLKSLVSPKQEKALFDLGQPGIYFGKREYRFYPYGTLASHIVGYTKVNEFDVNYAAISGISGVEKAFEDKLAVRNFNKVNNNKIVLSLDLPVQAEVENVLKEWQKRMGAKAGGLVIMNIHNGEIIALASSPDFDANKERSGSGKNKDASIYFNRVVQGVYEMGSTFKIFPVAQGLEKNLFKLDSLIDTRPFKISSKKIEDKYKFDNKSSVNEIIVRSSNVGAAKISLMVGETGLKEIFSTLGLLEPVNLELKEANLTQPIIPKNWQDISLATLSYGYGMSVSLLHMAKAYAILGNGGFNIEPTILKKKEVGHVGSRVLKQTTSDEILKLLEAVVMDQRGTAKILRSKYYRIGGKTGTAEKISIVKKGYQKDKVISNFVGIFPLSEPKFVIAAFLDEPENNFLQQPCRYASCTVVPMIRKLIERTGPLMNVIPQQNASKF